MRFLENPGQAHMPGPALLDDDLDARGNNFSWAIVILVLLGLNIGSWAFCSMVFGHPEHPFSYGLLTRLEKLKPVRGFKAITVPAGKFHTPKDIYGVIYPFTNSQLRAYNGMLRRNYLWNFDDQEPATFLFGSFRITGVRVLTEKDLFPRGLLVEADAIGFPDGKLELVLPTVDPVERTDYFSIGAEFQLEKASMASAILEVTRDEKGPITILAVPLVTKDASGGDRSFQTPSGDTLILKTPEWLNI